MRLFGSGVKRNFFFPVVAAKRIANLEPERRFSQGTNGSDWTNSDRDVAKPVEEGTTILVIPFLLVVTNPFLSSLLTT